MIKVYINKKNIKISGHAMFDDYGKDIVCASVSSIVITSINGILRLDKSAIKYDLNKDGINIDILKEDKVTNELILNMISLFKELEKNYSKNIKIYEEV